MTHDLKFMLSRAESMTSLITEGLKKDKKREDAASGTSYEVFRNNTTAVEVIVKEVGNKSKKKTDIGLNLNADNQKLKRLEEINEILAKELKNSNIMVQKTGNGYKFLIEELKKQLDEAISREAEMKGKYLNVQLENEKLNTLLQSNTNLVTKIKKELNNLRRVIKFVVKGLCLAPPMLESFKYISDDDDYDEFESDLKKDLYVKLENVFDGTTTYDSSITKDIKNSVNKHF